MLADADPPCPGGAGWSNGVWRSPPAPSCESIHDALPSQLRGVHPDDCLGAPLRGDVQRDEARRRHRPAHPTRAVSQLEPAWITDTISLPITIYTTLTHALF